MQVVFNFNKCLSNISNCRCNIGSGVSMEYAHIKAAGGIRFES